MADLQVVLSIDPATTSPQQARAWCDEWVAIGGEEVATAAVSASGGQLAGLDEQLARLTNYSPMFAERVLAVHNALIKMGYVPTLPKPKKPKKQLPSYVSYIDPATGNNIGNMNSEKFYVMRKELRAELAALPHFGADSRYAHVKLSSDEAAEALLKIAEREKK